MTLKTRPQTGNGALLHAKMPSNVKLSRTTFQHAKRSEALLRR